MVKVRDVMGMMGSWVDFMYKYISISFSGVRVISTINALFTSL